MLDVVSLRNRLFLMVVQWKPRLKYAASPDVLIDGLERLAAVSSIRAMPDVSIAVRTLIADL